MFFRQAPAESKLPAFPEIDGAAAVKSDQT